MPFITFLPVQILLWFNFRAIFASLVVFVCFVRRLKEGPKDQTEIWVHGYDYRTNASYVPNPMQWNNEKWTYVSFSSWKGETGRPGMPGEKGDAGDMVGDLSQSSSSTNTTVTTSPRIYHGAQPNNNGWFHCVTGECWRSWSRWLQWNEGRVHHHWHNISYTRE